MRNSILRGPFLLTTLANFFFFMNFASYFLLPLHVRALGGSEAWIGAVMGTSGLASLAVFPVIGLTFTSPPPCSVPTPAVNTAMPFSCSRPISRW